MWYDFTRTTGLRRKMLQIAKGTWVSKSINNIQWDEKLHLFQLYIPSQYQAHTKEDKLQFLVQTVLPRPVMRADPREADE